VLQGPELSQPGMALGVGAAGNFLPTAASQVSI